MKLHKTNIDCDDEQFVQVATEQLNEVVKAIVFPPPKDYKRMVRERLGIG